MSKCLRFTRQSYSNSKKNREKRFFIWSIQKKALPLRRSNKISKGRITAIRAAFLMSVGKIVVYIGTLWSCCNGTPILCLGLNSR